MINNKLYQTKRPIFCSMDNIFYEETEITLNVDANFIIKDKKQSEIDKITAKVHSLSQSRMRISFDNNNFLFNLFELIDNKELFLLCSLSFKNREFLFCTTPILINLLDIYKKEITALVTLRLSNKPTTKNNIVDLLTYTFMENVIIENNLVE